MAKAKDISETLQDVRRELDGKIESKVPIWIFSLIIALLFGALGAAYWNCMTQILDLTSKISSVQSIVNNKLPQK
ncbi:MAG: hypothetical protein WC645_00610 [Candidatus Margulisiibacteriota bacterium]